MVVSPCLFQAKSKQFNRLRTLGAPHEQAGGGGAESGDRPQNIFHRLLPFSNLLPLALDAGRGDGVLLILGEDFAARRKRLHFVYGFGSLRSCAWYRSPYGGEDAGDGGGCG